MEDQKKSKTSIEQKRAHISAWKQSKLSKVEYCKTHEIKYINFLNWFNQEKARKKTTSPFIPIEINNALPANASFATINCGSGLSIELHQVVGADFIKQILTACK